MSKKLLSIVSLLLISLALLVPHVQARPSYVNCESNACFSWLLWQGWVHGASTQTTASNSSYFLSGEFYQRYILGQNASAEIEAGIFIVGPNVSGGPCGNDLTSGATYFYTMMQDTLGRNWGSVCYLMDVSDQGKAVTLKFENYTTGNGGEIAEIQAANHSYSVVYDKGIYPYVATSYYTITLQDKAYANWSGTLIGKSIWNYNYWEHLDETWSYQTDPSPSNCTLTNGCPQPHNPPQFYWWAGHWPSDGGGGTLVTCAIDSGSTC